MIRGTRSDMEAGLSSGQGEAVSTAVVVDTASVPGMSHWWWRACRCRRVVSLICAGWLPQDGLFGGERFRGLDIERALVGSTPAGCS